MRRIELEAGVAEQWAQRRQQRLHIVLVNAQGFAPAQQARTIHVRRHVRRVGAQPGVADVAAQPRPGLAGIDQARQHRHRPVVRNQAEVPPQLRR